LIAIFCILSWPIVWMTMVGRINPEALPDSVLTKTEMELLDRLIDSSKGEQDSQQDVRRYLMKIAQLGGYLAQASDPPLGNTVM
jgi:hypothetical protein